MNILFYVSCTPNPQNGGIERVSHILAKELKKRGHKSYCIYQAEVEPGYESDVYEESIQIGLDDLKIKERFEQFIRKNDIDIVFNQMAYNQEGCDAFNVLRQECGFKLFTIYHNNPIICRRQVVPAHISGFKDIIKKGISLIFPEVMLRRRHRIDRSRLLKNLEATDKYVFLSPSYIRAIEKDWGVKSRKITAVENPVVYDTYFPISDYDKKDKIILFVGRYDEYQKRITEILKIWKKMQHEGHNGWRLVLGGHGADKDLYEKIIEKEGIEDIQLLGKIDPLEYYKKASIFIMTSSYEGWPMTMIESMQMGCVPIAYDSFTALRDIIIDSESGIVIKDGDCDGFIASLRELMTDDSKRKSMAEAAIKSVSKYSPEITAEKWLRLMK